MNILFVWSGLTGYMGDCWRELASKDGVQLKVAVDLGEKQIGGIFSADETLRGLDWSNDLPGKEYRPDYMFVVGWHNKLCRRAALRDWGANCRKIICFDMPWEWRIRKFAARFVLWRYLSRFDAAFIPGAATWPYARWLGFSKDRIFRGMYGTNMERFPPHIGGGGFLYVGRDAPEKGLDVLRTAYAMYKERGGRWELRIVNGISPDSLGKIYSGGDCFVLASRWEPWGVVLAEAAGAGLPVICTDKCGARHEVVGTNDFVVKAGDPRALADAMLKMERLDVEVRNVLGAGNRQLALSYSCAMWANKVLDILECLR